MPVERRDAIAKKVASLDYDVTDMETDPVPSPFAILPMLSIETFRSDRSTLLR
jgi:hypothetical protein